MVATQDKKTAPTLPTTEQALPFYGIQYGAISLRGGGATVLIEIDGFDFENHGYSRLNSLAQALGEAIKAVCKIGGFVTSGVNISFTLMQRRFDLSQMITKSRQASYQAVETGIAVAARQMEAYLTRLQDERPFIQRRYFIAISLDRRAYEEERAELEQTQNNGTTQDEELLEDAQLPGAGRVLATKSGKSFKEKLLDNLKETFEGDKTTKADFGIANGIELNPVPKNLAETLVQKADIMLEALRPFGVGGKVLNSDETAEVLAQMLFMPAKSPTKLINILARQVKGEALVPKRGDNEKLYQFGPQASIEATRFAYAPIEFAARYTRIGLPPELARTMYDYNQSGKRRKGQNSLSTSEGDYFDLPESNFIQTVYSMDWPRQLPFGVLFPLIARNDLEMNVTVQLVPITRKKAQSKLTNRRSNIETLQMTDNSQKSVYERREQIIAIDELLTQIAGDDGMLVKAGLRVSIRSDSQVNLARQVKSVVSALSGVGISVEAAIFNQALAFYSALPLARDYLHRAPLFGKRTVRNMTAVTAACLFPALLPEHADTAGIFVGRSEHGGITCISTKGLLAPHGIRYGASGSGKTVSAQAGISYRLQTNPDLSVLYTDPQGVLVKMAKELGGLVLDMSAEAQDKVRLNFLDRFILGGKPVPFLDLITVFLTFVSIMQRQTLSAGEKAAITSCLTRLSRHFELGEEITRIILAGIRNRFNAQLELGVPGRIELLADTITAIYTAIRKEHNIPGQGYVVRVHNTPSGKPEIKFGSEEERLKYFTSPPGEKEQYGAVELIVLPTRPAARLSRLKGEAGRNFYAGGGEYIVQIPLRAFNQMSQAVLEKKSGGDLDGTPWLITLLLRYLCSETPRRLPDTTEWLVPKMELDNGGELRVVSDPEIPATHLVYEGGPCWFAEDEWAERVAATFTAQYTACGLFDNLNREETSIVMRDLMVGLKHGVPILSDLLPVLAAEPYGFDLARNLEMFCDPDMGGSLFNGHTNVNVTSRFMVFDIKNVSDELRPLRMMQCMQLSWRLIATNSAMNPKKYLLIVDEFGVVSKQSPEVAEYIGLLYKRSRAFGGEVWVIDQDSSSLHGGIGRYVVSNVGIVEIMKQDRQDLSYWQGMFDLTNEEVDRIANFGPGEVMIILREEGRNRKIVARYTMSDTMLKLYSTRQADVQNYLKAQQAASGAVEDTTSTLIQEVLGYSFT